MIVHVHIYAHRRSYNLPILYNLKLSQYRQHGMLDTTAPPSQHMTLCTCLYLSDTVYSSVVEHHVLGAELPQQLGQVVSVPLATPTQTDTDISLTWIRELL